MSRDRSTTIAAVLFAIPFATALGSPPDAIGQTANLENPADGSMQSGIALVSGWKCSATNLTASVDGGPAFSLAYGTSREDTLGLCGDSDNGFGYLLNFSLFENGTHTVRVFDGGVEFGTRTFTVTRVADLPFATGLTGASLLREFPSPGLGVTMVWDPARQGFVVGGQCGDTDGPPCPVTTSQYGWAWANEEAAAAYAPAIGYRYSSSGGNIQMTRSGVGEYTATFEGLAPSVSAPVGIVHVTPYASSATCQNAALDFLGADVRVTVHCFGPTGAAVDSRYLVFYGNPAFDGAQRAHALYVPGVGTPAPHGAQLSWSGGFIDVSEPAPGTSAATFTGVNTTDGVFLVTGTGGSARRCRVANADSSLSQLRANVRCNDPSGVASATGYRLTWLNDTSLVRPPNLESATLWFDTPGASSTPPASRQSNSTGGTNSVTRNGPGDYYVELGGLAAANGGHVQLAVTGADDRSCSVRQWYPASADLGIDVECFDAAGAAADSGFALTYLR